MTTRSESLVVINVFTPKPDAVEAFQALQVDALPRLGAMVQGGRGSRLYRADDRSKFVMVSVFDSVEDFKRFSENEAFVAHRNRVLPYLETSQPGRYELIYQTGEV